MIKKKFYDIPILLLGPGNEHRTFRGKVEQELREKGYTKIIIMEFTPDQLIDVRLENKFRRIIQNYNPVLVIAFFHSGARMDGVTFELGWLCRNYRPGQLRDKLKILEEKNYDWSETTPYIEDLFSNIHHRSFDELKNHCKASTLIDKFALDFTLGDI